MRASLIIVQRIAISKANRVDIKIPVKFMTNKSFDKLREEAKKQGIDKDSYKDIQRKREKDKHTIEVDQLWSYYFTYLGQIKRL